MPLDFEFRPGRKPPHPDETHPRVWMDDFLPAQGPSDTVLTADWCSNVTAWPMSLNGPDPSDPAAPILGTCGWAALNNFQIAEHTYGDGNVSAWPNSTILSLYEQTGGYVPGDPTTDNGTVLQDNLTFWRHNPINGDEILFFGQLRPGTWLRPERLRALRTLGPIYLGHNLPQSAENEFPGPWTYVPGSPDIGGHATLLAAEFTGMDEARDVSWMVPVPATRSFLMHTVDEAWVIGTAAGLERNQQTQYGVDVQGLNQALAALTGESNPLRLKTIL